MRARFSALLVCAMAILGSPAFSDETESVWNRLGLGGSVRDGYFSHPRDFTSNGGVDTLSLWGRAEPRLTDNVKAFVEGWGRNDDLLRVTSPEGGVSRFKGDVREAYVDGSLGALDFRVGRQIIAWGRADALNPTDNLSVRNFTLMTPNDGDQRGGVGAVSLAYNVSSFRFTGVWLPEYRSNTLPIPPVAGVTLTELTPQNPWGQYALKVEETMGRVEWSASYFDGYDRNPDLAFEGATPTGLAVALVHHRLRVVGADAAANVGKLGLRGEAAYTFTENMGGTDPLTKRPFFYGVVGADRTFLESLNVNVQYVYRYISNYQDPSLIADPNLRLLAVKQATVNNQLDPQQHGATVRLAKRWLNESLETEISGLLWFQRGDWVARPKVTYALTDHLKATLGVDYYHGPAVSFLGQLQGLSAGYGEVRWDF